MPLGRGIVEVFEAIPERIEVSGHGPTWRVTGGSFEAVLTYAREAFGDTAVVDRADRSRWWPRVTLTVTKDPDLAAEAPPVETFADPEPGSEEAAPVDDGVDDGADEGLVIDDDAAALDGESEDIGEVGSTLEEIFAHQEELRAARRRIPQQRSPRR